MIIIIDYYLMYYGNSVLKICCIHKFDEICYIQVS